MDEKTMLLLKGQSLIMEMLISMMPAALEEAWINEVNEHNQEIVELLKRSGFDVKKREEPKEETKE